MNPPVRRRTATHLFSIAPLWGLLVVAAVGGAATGAEPAAIAVTESSTESAAESFARVSATGFRPVTPVRVVDTRSGLGGAQFGAGETRAISLDAVLPADATGVSLNVTAVSPTEATFLTVWPTGPAQPDSSTLNVTAGGTRPNAVLVGLGADRSISVANDRGEVHVLVDVMGYSTAGFHGVTPVRRLDTRSGVGGTTLPAGAARSVRVAGVAGVPADATAVAVNLTATGALGETYLTAWPSGTDRPGTSNLNVATGATVANLAVVGVGAGGAIDVGNGPARVDALVDVLGWFDDEGGLVPITPRRVVDTREAPCDVRLGPGETRRIVLSSTASTAHVLNVTAVGATAPTHLRVWPAGRPRVATSNVNVTAAGDGAVANAVVVGSGDGGAVEVYNEAGYVHLIVDLFGGFGAAPSPSAWTPDCAAPASIGSDWLDPVERELVDAVNAFRATNGRSPLVACRTLTEASRDFARVTLDVGGLAHTGPDGSTPASRAVASGYGSSFVGENLARGYRSVPEVMNAWIDSSGHRRNLLSDLDHLGVARGVGAAGTPVWVQMFGAGGHCG